MGEPNMQWRHKVKARKVEFWSGYGAPAVSPAMRMVGSLIKYPFHIVRLPLQMQQGREEAASS